MPKPLVLPPIQRTMHDAQAFARVAHKGQTDKAGRPYFLHLARVHERLINMLDGLPHDRWDDLLQIAYLHDVIEDTEYTADDLLREGFGSDVVDAVMNLTRKGGLSRYGQRVTYDAWIRWLATTADLPTILVKIADVEDNSDPERLALLPDDVRARLERKYAPALVILREAAVRLGWVEPEQEPTR